MGTHFYTPVRGKRIRITELDKCGRITAESKQMVTDGFITVNLSAEVEDGNEITQKNANGAVCISERSSSSFKRLTVGLNFCGVNPSIAAMVSNAKTYEDHGGDIAGIVMEEGEFDKRYALEIWTGLSGQACTEGADEASGYILLPYVQAGTMGDFEIGAENAVNFSTNGSYTIGGNVWGVGPYDVVYNASGVASPLPTPLTPETHFLMMDTGLAVPAVMEEPEIAPTPPVSSTTTTTTTGV